jgi:serine phosphatase RsbU (regulator of sigma subunit)
MLKLRIVPADGDPLEVPLEEDSLVIGRSSASDLVVRDRFLSRRHARLFRREDQLVLEDLGARNGTFVNHKQISSPTVVHPGDDIRLAGSLLQLIDTEAPLQTRSGAEFSLENASIVRPAADFLERVDSTSGTKRLARDEDVRRYAERLRLMLDVHKALGGTLELDRLLEMILARVFEHLKPEQAAIYLKDPSGGFYSAASRSLPGSSVALSPARSLIEEVADRGIAALVVDVASDERFAQAESIVMSGVRSLIAAPLLEEEGGSLGLIVLSSTAASKQFAEEDLELLVSLASVAALRIRNAALAGEAAERARLEQELLLAREIQERLLPQRLPSLQGWQLFGRNVASRGVSGDLYQILTRDEGRECVLLVADVSGKGMAASLLAASLEALAAGPLEVGHPPDEICNRVSRRLHQRTLSAKYATLFLAVLDPETGIVRYTNAGHNPALIVRVSGQVESLRSNGLPVGLFGGFEYAIETTSLQQGDTLVIYTDGITEACNPADEQYGTGRLQALLVTERQSSLAEMAEALEKDLVSFASNVPFADDRTLVMARRASG